MTRSSPGAQLGAYLAELRIQQGLTQRQLAEKLGLSSGEVVSRWERGEREPRLDMLSAVAAALDVKVNDLVNAAFGVRMMRVSVLGSGGSSSRLPATATASRVPNPAGSDACSTQPGRDALVSALAVRMLEADEPAFRVAYCVASAALDALAASDGAAPQEPG